MEQDARYSAHLRAYIVPSNPVADLLQAGLFSAVATAFIIESYKLLQPDNNDYIAAALYVIALSSGNSSGAPPISPPTASPLSTVISRLLNGLWFTSLFLALAVALLSILVKQWLGEYTDRTMASAKNPHEWARRRAFFFAGLSTWRMAEFIALLPVMLHLSLFMFLAGIAVLLCTLDGVIGAVISGLSGSLLLFYVVTTVIPRVWVNCPTSTPLIRHAQKAWNSAFLMSTRVLLQLTAPLLGVYSAVTVGLHRVMHQDQDLEASGPSPAAAEIRFQRFQALLQRLLYHFMSQSDLEILKRHIEFRREALDAEALKWLVLDVSDSDAAVVGLEALGSLPPYSRTASMMRVAPVLSAMETLKGSITEGTHVTAISRIRRASLCVRESHSRASDMRLGPVIDRLLAYEDPDLLLLYSLYAGYGMDYSPLRILSAESVRESPSLPSLAMLALHHQHRLDQQVLYMWCLNVQDIADSDWSGILYALCEILEPGTIWLPHHHRYDVCTRRCFVEHIAGLLVRREELQLSSACINSLTETLRRSVIARSDADLFALPSLLEFIADDLFRSLDISREFLFMCRHSFFGDHYIDLMDITTPSTLRRASRNMLYAGTMIRDPGSAFWSKYLAVTTARVYSLLLLQDSNPGGQHDYFHPHTNCGDNLLSPATLDILSEWTGNPQTAVSELEILQAEVYHLVVLRLMTFDAKGICFLSRNGGDASARVEELLSAASGMLAPIFQTARKYQDVYEFETSRFNQLSDLLQHLIELRPSAWPTMIQDITAGEHTDDFWDWILLLVTGVSERGPCTNCTNAPPNWDALIDASSTLR